MGARPPASWPSFCDFKTSPCWSLYVWMLIRETPILVVALLKYLVIFITCARAVDFRRTIVYVRSELLTIHFMLFYPFHLSVFLSEIPGSNPILRIQNWFISKGTFSQNSADSIYYEQKWDKYINMARGLKYGTRLIITILTFKLSSPIYTTKSL